MPFLSDNASTLDKRFVSAPIQLGIHNINSVFPQLAIVKADARTSIKTRLKKADTNCCVISGYVTAKEADAVIAVATTLVPDVTTALISVVTKKPQYDNIISAIAFFKTDIKNMDTQVTALDICLDVRTPSTHFTVANALVTQINASFATTKTADDI